MIASLIKSQSSALTSSSSIFMHQNPPLLCSTLQMQQSITHIRLC